MADQDNIANLLRGCGGRWPTTTRSAVLLGVIGWALQAMAPEANSIGPALRELFM
ncbi:MAG: hypothetical protein KJ072_23575 [Verrucomicrobia bacterium]|nr:hypothetical protein [Verrucomicrobiota bacterium]